MKNLKRLSLPVCVLSASLLTQPAFALDDQQKKSIKQGSSFVSGALIGGMAGGPFGMIIGAVSGALLAENSIRKDEKLDLANDNARKLGDKLTMHEATIERLEKSASNTLEFAILFPTGEDLLSHQDNKRIHSLANYLVDNPHLQVRIDAHTDPRGTDEYNNVLSVERALAIVTALEGQGISSDRIEYHAHGSSFSNANTGDVDAYSFERRVDIQVYPEESANDIAVVN